MIFLRDDQFLWRSERDGYDHFYLYNNKGKMLQKLTDGTIVVKDYIGTKDNEIFFSAFSSDGLDVNLYSYSISDKTQQKITNKFPGYHYLQISPSGNFLLMNFQI